MSGIAIVNQLLLIFNLAIFGAISGAGIFGAQFYGCRNHKGVQQTFRFKLYICAAIVLAGVFLLLAKGDSLILLYLHGEGNEAALEATLGYGREYLLVMLTGLLPFAIEEIYSGTLRECGETKLPMKAGIAAVCVNLLLNYLLIYGKFGLPELGVVGDSDCYCHLPLCTGRCSYYLDAYPCGEDAFYCRSLQEMENSGTACKEYCY